MSQDWCKDIEEFMAEMGQEIGVYPFIPNEATTFLREEIVEEEYTELMEGLAEGNLEKVADGCVDLCVVVIGTAIAYGIDLRSIWDEIHKTNMAKVGGPIRADGKRLKPEGWKPPEVARLLIEQGLDPDG